MLCVMLKRVRAHAFVCDARDASEPEAKKAKVEPVAGTLPPAYCPTPPIRAARCWYSALY